jgi:hypothetical protein
MGQYVLTYKGGGMDETEAEQQEAMTNWMKWFGLLADDVVDGGTPFASDGAVSQGGASDLTGYSIITAETLSEACDKAKGRPVLSSGGSIEVYEALPIG